MIFGICFGSILSNRSVSFFWTEQAMQSGIRISFFLERSVVKIGFPASNLSPPLTHREVVVSLLHITRLEPAE
jgi:hypothetical protein